MPLGPSISSFDELTSEVSKFIRPYDWVSAAELCNEFLTKQGETEFRAFELLGDCYYNAAFQQNIRDDFKKVILGARDAYERFADDKRCRARAAYCKYWASDDPDERRQVIIDECIPLGRQGVVQLEHSEDERIVARAYVELMEYLLEGCTIASDKKHLDEFVREAKLTGKNALIRFRNSKDHESLVLITNVYFLLLAGPLCGIFLEKDTEFNEISEEIVPVGDLLAGIADKSENTRIKCLGYEAAGLIETEFKHDFVAGSSLIEKALIEAEKTNDLYVIGRQSFFAVYSPSWLYNTIDDPEKIKEILERLSRFGLRAIENLKVPLATSFLEGAFFWFVVYLTKVAKNAQKVSEKIDALDRAIAVGREGISYGPFYPLSSIAMALGLASLHKADLISEENERENLLVEAIGFNKNCVEQFELLIGQNSWNLGAVYGVLGSLESRLSDEKKNPLEKQALLKESCLGFSKSVDLLTKSPAFNGRESIPAERCEGLGEALLKIYELSHNTDDCVSAIKAYENAVGYYSTLSMFGFIAPLTWKIGELYDRISEFEKSADSFSKAAELYESAAKNQKSLSRSFIDLALYMRAWSNIEKARLDHRDEKYPLASERLREASVTLDKSEAYKHLAKHYEAYSKAEEGEDLSRKESNKEAATNFENASQLFGEAENEMLKIAREKPLDNAEIKNWAKLSKQRAAYCKARRELEEAKALDRNGQAEASMYRYRTAAQSFKELGHGLNEQDTRELDALAISCEAWSIMKEADYSSSPELYSKASQLFLKAKDKKLRQSFVLSCLANASMCEALAAGTTFKRSSDVPLYSEIKTKLGAASRYYEEAGLEIASDWTRATEALFDALAYLAGAEREIDPQKKTQMYHLAEKHLELSARRYGDIGYDRKRQEVLKHLKTARENKEMLLTPMEALSQNPTVSATPVNFTRDQAVGLERFEVANLTGNMSISSRSTNVGSTVRIDIDIANVGKTPALLMKLDGLAPWNAFEPEAEKNQYHFLEGGGSIAIDLKGKRLEYLKTHEMSIHLRAKSKGTFELKPKILFVDELGKYRSYEFEPQGMEIKEFARWVKEKQERKLAAIMFADIVGYTSISQRNESLALELLGEYRGLLRPIFPSHNGSEIKTIGDSFLVEFASALEAVKCAFEIQQSLHVRNAAQLLQEKTIDVRIGIHLGDVVYNENDVYGDAVNVASRIEPLSEPGGICISQQVYDHIRNKFEFPLVSLGRKELKNVEIPVEVYRVALPWKMIRAGAGEPDRPKKKK